MSISFEELIETHCGIRGGWDNLVAVIPGGSSVPLMRGENMRDAIMDFDYCVVIWDQVWEPRRDCHG